MLFSSSALLTIFSLRIFLARQSADRGPAYGTPNVQGVSGGQPGKGGKGRPRAEAHRENPAIKANWLGA
jgi:hypothetical protein